MRSRLRLKAQQAAAIAQQEKNEGNSPCTGIITDLQAANNATVQKDQVILHIKAVDSCSITLNVSAAQAKELKAGMPVSIKAAETPAPFSGKISSIDGTKITVTSEQKPEDLKDGAKAEISLASFHAQSCFSAVKQLRVCKMPMSLFSVSAV